LRQVDSKEAERDQLRQVRLGGGDPDLRASLRVKHGIGFTSQRTAYDIYNAQGLRALLLRLPHGGQCIGRLAALAYEDDQGLFVHERIAIPELRRHSRFDWPPQ